MDGNSSSDRTKGTMHSLVCSDNRQLSVDIGRIASFVQHHRSRRLGRPAIPESHRLVPAPGHQQLVLGNPMARLDGRVMLQNEQEALGVRMFLTSLVDTVLASEPSSCCPETQKFCGAAKQGASAAGDIPEPQWSTMSSRDPTAWLWCLHLHRKPCCRHQTTRCPKQAPPSGWLLSARCCRSLPPPSTTPDAARL